MSHFDIKDSVDRLFAQEVNRELIERTEGGEFPVKLWQLVSDSGFSTLMATEAAGGIEADWESAFDLLCGLGYHQVPLPVAETGIATLLLSAAGLAEPLNWDGQPIALVGEKQAAALQVSVVGDSLQLSGVLKAVPWARWASLLLLGLPDGQLVLLDLKSPQIQCQAGEDVSRMPADTLTLTQASPVQVFANPWPELNWPVWTLGAAARATMMVGALEFALDQAVQYAKDRVQFGQPIGKNQAIQQQLAQLAGEFTSARAAAVMACRDLPSLGQRDARSAHFSTAVAKIRAGEAANRGTAIAHQVHGAIGFTYEHALNFATRRLWAWRDDFGGASWWATRLGESFIEARAAQFWPALTERQAPQPLRMR